MTMNRHLTCVNDTAIGSIQTAETGKIGASKLPIDAVTSAAFSAVSSAGHLDEHRGEFDVPPPRKGSPLLVLAPPVAGDDLVTWSKLSDDFTDDCWTLSDAAHRLHVDGIVWSNRKLLDMRVPKEDLRRFAKRPEAAPELIACGWWSDDGDAYIINHHAQYQRLKSDVVKQQSANARNGRKGGRPRKPGREQASDLTPQETESVSHSPGEPRTERDRTGQDGSGREAGEQEHVTESLFPARRPDDLALDRCAECGHRERLGPDALCNDCASAHSGPGHAVTEAEADLAPESDGARELTEDEEWQREWGAA